MGERVLPRGNMNLVVISVGDWAIHLHAMISTAIRQVHDYSFLCVRTRARFWALIVGTLIEIETGLNKNQHFLIRGGDKHKRIAFGLVSSNPINSLFAPLIHPFVTELGRRGGEVMGREERSFEWGLIYASANAITGGGK